MREKEKVGMVESEWEAMRVGSSERGVGGCRWCTDAVCVGELVTVTRYWGSTGLRMMCRLEGHEDTDRRTRRGGHAQEDTQRRTRTTDRRTHTVGHAEEA